MEGVLGSTQSASSVHASFLERHQYPRIVLGPLPQPPTKLGEQKPLEQSASVLQSPPRHRCELNGPSLHAQTRPPLALQSASAWHASSRYAHMFNNPI